METDRPVIITGVSRGLGLALAKRFAEQGFHVVGCSRHSEDTDKLQREFGDQHLFLPCDVSDEKQVSQFSEKALDRFGPPRYLINNAALINPSAPLWEQKATDLAALFSVNLLGVCLMVKAFAPAMIAERSQSFIINLSSGWGRSTSPDVAPYCASKWGIEGLTKSLASELPHHVAAIPLNPGVIDTDMLRSCFGGSADGYVRPEEWSENALHMILNLNVRDNGSSLSVPE